LHLLFGRQETNKVHELVPDPGITHKNNGFVGNTPFVPSVVVVPDNKPPFLRFVWFRSVLFPYVLRHLIIIQTPIFGVDVDAVVVVVAAAVVVAAVVASTTVVVGDPAILFRVVVVIRLVGSDSARLEPPTPGVAATATVVPEQGPLVPQVVQQKRWKEQ